MSKILNKSYIDLITYSSFGLLIFTIFFGTGLPWQEAVETWEEKGTSNIINQIVYSIVFIQSCLLLFRYRHEIFSLILQEKFFSLFLLWCFLGIFWSHEKFMTFKAAFRLLTMHIAVISFLLHFGSVKELLKVIKPILLSYIIVNLLTIFLIPAAIDPQFGTWRGIMDQKNLLGQYSIVSFVLCLIILNDIKNDFMSKSTIIFFAFLAMILAIGSRSSTALITLFLVLIMCIYLFFENIFKGIGFRNVARVLTIFTFISVFFLIYFYQSALFSDIPNIFGKDSTLSGRTILWQTVLEQNKDHIYRGGGLAAFWSPQNQMLINLSGKLQWMANESHNGFVDMIIDNGIIGLIIFMLIIIRFYFNSMKLEGNEYYLILVSGILILNLQETTFMSPGRLVTLGLILSYWVIEFKLFMQYTNLVSDNFDNG